MLSSGVGVVNTTPGRLVDGTDKRRVGRAFVRARASAGSKLHPPSRNIVSVEVGDSSRALRGNEHRGVDATRERRRDGGKYVIFPVVPLVWARVVEVSL